MKNIKITNVNALQFFQIARYGALMLIGILLAKSGIGKTAIGHYETFLLISGAFTLFWVNGFLKVMMPVYTEKNEVQRPVIIFNIFLLLLFFSILAAVLMLFINQPFSVILLKGNQVPMPVILAFYIIFNSPSLLTEYIYLVKKLPKHIIVYALVVFSVQIIAVALPALLGHGLNVILPSLLGVSMLRFIWLLVVLYQHSERKVQFSFMSEFLRYGSPLVLATLLSSSARYIDGFIITSHFSPDEFAVFQYGARELPLAMLLSNSLSMAMLPSLAREKIDSPLAEFRSEVYRLFWILFPVSILLMFTSHWFYPLVFSAEFAPAATIFNIYLLLVISRILFPQTILTAKKMNRSIVRASFFEITLNVGLSLILVQIIGLEGVAYATVLAYLCEKVYLAIVCKRKLKISIMQYLPFRLYIVASVLLIVSFIIVEFIIY